MTKFIEKYIPMADMIAETFGSECEVVLHDLTDPQHSVSYVANNTVTGRTVGDSFDVLVKEVMMSPKLRESYVANYFFTAKNGKLIRSSTMLLRDDGGRVQGALCINLDTTRVSDQIRYLQSFMPRQEVQEPALPGGSENVRNLVSDLVENIMGNSDPTQMNREEKVERIRFMDSRGIFLMKGAVELVAEKMQVNKVTVYSYLDEARGKRG